MRRPQYATEAAATPLPAKLYPRVRHGRELDMPAVERIARPAGSMPRHESDWR
jgi:hypothetical protein